MISIAAPLLMLVEVFMDLLQPVLMARIIDFGISTGDVNYIYMNGLFMLLVALIGVLCGLGCVILSNVAAQNLAADLRCDLFKKIQSFSFAELDRFRTGSLITRLTNDISQVQMVVALMMRLMIRAPFLFFGGLTMAFILNARMAWVLVATLPFMAFVLAILIKKGFSLFALAQKKLDRLNTVLQENLAGVRVVKAFDRADYEQKRFDDSVNDLMENLIKVAKISSFAMPAVMLIMNLGVIAVIWVGGLEFAEGNMEIGNILAFITYAGQIMFSLAMMAMVLMFVSRGKASGDRIVEVLNVESSIKENTSQDLKDFESFTIEFDNVSFRYGGENKNLVLKNVSLKIEEGKTVAILGATGSGKSSLINLLSRMYDATEGQVLFGNQNVKDLPLQKLRDVIGVVMQDAIILSGTIEENIRFGKLDASEEEIVAAAKVAQLHDFVASLPEGYKTVLGQKGVNLSGGQKQRLDIARAIVKKPLVLILDDSTSAVDPETEWKIHKAIKRFTENITCIIVAQRITSVLEADNIILIDHGQIVAEGTHYSLLKTSPHYKELYMSQIEEEAV